MDIVIIGAGIIGLTVAKAIKSHDRSIEVTIVEKEYKEAMHASGRNSGVLHAGFYYTYDSLKAKFCKEGNIAWTNYCKEKNLPINKNKKVVVAQNEEELIILEQLILRAESNGIEARSINEEELYQIEPNAKTYKKALYSPTTSTIDPVLICATIKRDLEEEGVNFIFNDGYLSRIEGGIKLTSGREIKASKIINCAGLYADKIAKGYGFGLKYTILPFKGIYLKATRNYQAIKTNIYPVPNINNPFLGVHFTVTVDGTIKIGPTAIPAFWRENYKKTSAFQLNEFIEIIYYEMKLFILNKFHFRRLVTDEIQKYKKKYFIELASKLVQHIDKSVFAEWSNPGIRAQLLNTETMELVQDFIVEGDATSVHVLNAVSPAFTAALPFAEWIVQNYVIRHIE